MLTHRYASSLHCRHVETKQARLQERIFFSNRHTDNLLGEQEEKDNDRVEGRDEWMDGVKPFEKTLHFLPPNFLALKWYNFFL